jgi:hypothetical protein
MQAWSQIRGNEGTTANPGDDVTAADLKLSDEEFQVLVDEGAVREVPYPKDLPAEESPTEYVRKQVAEALVTGAILEPEPQKLAETAGVKTPTATAPQAEAAEEKK